MCYFLNLDKNINASIKTTTKTIRATITCAMIIQNIKQTWRLFDNLDLVLLPVYLYHSFFTNKTWCLVLFTVFWLDASDIREPFPTEMRDI
jgi:hypothetical protein